MKPSVFSTKTELQKWAPIFLTLNLFAGCAGTPATHSQMPTHVAPQKWMHLSENPPENPRTPPSFAQGQVSAQIQQRLASSKNGFRETVAQEKIRARTGLPRFYEMRNYEPAWVNDQGPLPRAQHLFQSILDSEADGLTPLSFHLPVLSLLLAESERRRYLGIQMEPLRLAELELLLTDAFLTLSNQLQTGRIAPKQAHFEFYLPREGIKDPVKLLTEAIQTNRIAETLKEALPQTQEYRSLRLALANYRKIAKNGGWNPIPPGKAIRLGEQNWRIPLLRKRLLISHDLSETDTLLLSDKNLFDPNLSLALKNFQSRHGLKPHGILDRNSLRALNVSAQKRVRQILINLERLRWSPHDFGDRYIAVNTADFQLKFIDPGRPTLTMPVIVGNLYKQTPIFSSQMTHTVLNPYWYVPKSIVIETMLDKIKKDPSYLKSNHFTVFKSKNKSWHEVPAEQINWDQITDENFDLNLRRDPGPGNPLGQVKFIFPNPWNIYFHDTNEKDLFKKGVRTLSSGCIRLAQPMELLDLVLNPSEENTPKEWTQERITELLKTGNETEIPIKTPIPVHMLYATAWVNEQGVLQFREDVYGRDEVLDQFL